jgi:hypothetical protein
MNIKKSRVCQDIMVWVNFVSKLTNGFATLQFFSLTHLDFLKNGKMAIYLYLINEEVYLVN